jgi:hypothetical protein
MESPDEAIRMAPPPTYGFSGGASHAVPSGETRPGRITSTPPPNVHLNNPAGDSVGATQSNPLVASIGDKVVAVWANTTVGVTNESRIQYAVSTDSGATYTDLGTVPAPAGAVTYRWQVDPQIVARASTGEFWVAGQISTLSGASPNHLGVGLVRGTFSGSTLVWGAPRVVRDFSPVPVIYLAALALQINPSTGDLYLLFSNNYAPAGQIEFQRSSDGGNTWTSPLALSSAADFGNVISPELAVGSGNDVYAAWTGKLIGTHTPLRFRNSTDGGTTWQPEQTVAEIRSNEGLPGIQSFSGTYSMAANRVSGSIDEGRVAIAWAETWNFEDESFTPLTSTPFHAEAESNNTPGAANPFTLGEALVGSFSTTSDRDYWQVPLVAGAQIALWPDSMTNVRTFVSVVDPGGAEMVITGLNYNNLLPFTFSAPVTGTYYVRCGPNFDTFTTPAYYRVRTRTSSSMPGEARDQRDLVVAHSTGSGASLTWATPVHYAFTAPGYDDFMPTIGWGADGLDYVSWYDFSQFTSGGQSELVIARNLAGSDPVPSSPRNITDAATDWTALTFIIPSQMGWWNGIRADDRRVHLSWADGRSGDPDCYSARLATTVVSGPCQRDTSVQGGRTTVLSFGLTNQNPIFDEKLSLTASGARAWPGNGTVRDSVPPNSYGTVKLSIAVPDTAAAGIYPLCVTIRRQSGLPVFTCCVNLDVQVATLSYRDADGDGFGDPAVHVVGQQVGYVADNTDCDDTHASVHPGAPEICDGLDNNCNGRVDEAAQAPGLVGWWPGNGNANDATGNNNGAAGGTLTYAPGKVYQAFSFDGAGYVSNLGTTGSFSFIENTGVFTIEAWIKLSDPNALVQQAITASTSTSNEKGYFFIWENSAGEQRLRLGLEKASVGVPVIESASPTNVITTNGWHHVAAAGDGSNITFYVDGVAYAGSGVMGAKPSGASNRIANIGRCPSSSPECQFSGLIDEPAIYNRALSASEIHSIYAADSSGRCALVGVNDPSPSTRGFEFAPPWPNPAEQVMNFELQLPARARVRAEVVDVAGRRVSPLLEDGVLAAGAHRLRWDGRDASGQRVAPGVYLVRISTGGAAVVRTIVLIK